MKNTWHRSLVYRKEVLKTTWKLRLFIGLVLAAVVIVPRGFWAKEIGQSLACEEDVVHSDALLVENFDINYPVFQRAAALQRAGVSSRALVPVNTGVGPSALKEMSGQFVEVMARVARLREFEIIPFEEKEPISLNAAKQIRDFLKKEHINSVIVVSPGFRSRRSQMVYKSALEPAGIRVGCIAVFGTRTPLNWTSTWHGIQEAGQQFLKLQYYRFYVLL